MLILWLQLIANALLVIGATILALLSVSPETIKMINKSGWITRNKWAYFAILFVAYIFGRGIVPAAIGDHDYIKWLLPLNALLDTAGIPQSPDWLAIIIEVGAASAFLAFIFVELLFHNVFSLPLEADGNREKLAARWNIWALLAVLVGFIVQMGLLTATVIAADRITTPG